MLSIGRKVLALYVAIVGCASSDLILRTTISQNFLHVGIGFPTRGNWLSYVWELPILHVRALLKAKGDSLLTL